MNNFENNNYSVEPVKTIKNEQLSVAEIMGLDPESEVVLRFKENMEMQKNSINKITHFNEALLKLDMQENTTNQLGQLFWTNMDYVNFQDKASILIEELA